MLTAGGIATDGCGYLWLAQKIAAGDYHAMFSSIWPLLFPLLTAVFSFVFTDFELSARIASCLFGSLAIFPLYILTKEVFNKKIGLTVALFFCIHPYLTQSSGEVLTEALYYFVLITIICLTWIALQKRKTFLFLIIGTLLVVLFLTRFEGIAPVFLVLGWVWLKRTPPTPRLFYWKTISTIFCLIPFITILLGYLFFVRQETGRWQLSPRQDNNITIFVKSQDSRRPPLAQAWATLKYKLTVNPLQVPQNFIKACHPVFFVLLLFGIINRKRMKGFCAGEGYLLSFIVLRLSVLIIFAGINERYLYAIVPIVLIWASVGFWEINNWLLGASKNKTVLLYTEKVSRGSIVILIVILAICLPRALKPIRGHREVQRAAGLWLKDHVGPKKFIVVAYNPQEAYHAQAIYHKLQGANYDEIISHARNVDADFLIIDKNIQNICPDFQEMVDNNEDMEVLSRKFETDERAIVIYKLKRE